MYFSKAIVVALWCQCTLAASVTEDTDGCAAFPREDSSLGQHAMLQQSAKPSKEEIVLEIDDIEKEPLKVKNSEKHSKGDVLKVIDIDAETKEPLGKDFTVIAIDSIEKLPLKKNRKMKHLDILESKKQSKKDSLTVIDIDDLEKEPLETGQTAKDILNMPKSGKLPEGESLTVIDIEDVEKEPVGKDLLWTDIDDFEKEPLERDHKVKDILNSKSSGSKQDAFTVIHIDDVSKQPLDKSSTVIDIDDLEKEPLRRSDVMHAMLQQSAKPSKGDVLTIGNAASPTDSMMPPILTGSVDPLTPPVPAAFDIDSIEREPLETGVVEANVPTQMEEQQVFLSNPVPTDSMSLQTDEQAPLPAQPATASVVPQMEEPELLLSDPMPTNSISSETAENTLQNEALSPVVPATQQELLAEACDWQCYLNRYPDLLSVVGANNVDAAEQHWNTVGKSEGRDCTCAAGESLAVMDDALNDIELATQFKASANVMDVVTSCQPLSPAGHAQREAEIRDYEASEKFQEKISEAEGKSPASAGHVAIMKYLREKVLKPGLSVLELGCGAGGMLRFIEDEYNIGWGGGYYAKAVPHGSLVGVELVPGWVQFAQEHFKNISIYQGDITEYSLPEPYATEKFDLVMLNDVMEHVEKTRYGCFFSQLDKATSAGSLVYMHTPSPMAQLEEKKLLSESSTQFKENVVPHHFVVTGMASVGFELLTFEHDMDTVCGGEAQNLPKQLQGAHCYYNGWPKYTHNVFRKVQDPAVMNMS